MQGNVGFQNNVHTEYFNQKASSSVTPIISDYLYIIKESLSKKIIELIYQNREVDDSKSKEIFNKVDQYIQKTKLYLDDSDKDPIILALIGGLSNEVLNSYIQYIQTKYASSLVEKFIKSNVNSKDDILTRSDMFKNIGFIKIGNDDSNKPYILDYKESFTNSLEKPTSNLIQAFLEALEGNRRFSPFRFTYDPIVSQEIQNDTQFYIYNNDYTSSVVNDDSIMCMEIDNDLIELLVNNYCPINKRDKEGHSAIFYAIKNQHYSSLNKLLELEADFYSVPNKLNQTPIEYAQDLYKLNLDYIFDSSISKMIKKFYKHSYNITKNIILDNPSFRNNLIKYTESGYGMMISMINHWCLNLTLDYDTNWNFDDKNILINMLTFIYVLYKVFRE